ncbi:hypothetical protein BJX68DRAFT_34389 [Aspergillus pseudodeflectus]|uniref:BTB domain-containing protein n=1 Tax=Aspergillus pseudodeflectus TaxID=176178 RepID=A0ABR4J9G8_9EURO
MTSEEPIGNLLDMSYEEFAKVSLPLYHGPMVKIKIGPTAYDVSKTLLCNRSPYFAGMFNGKFKEGQEHSAVLEEIEGVVSNRSFRLFLQWLYLGRVILGKESPTDWISAMIEFARLADMLSISNVESQIIEHIRATILDNVPDVYSRDRLVHHMTPEHVYAATRLPKGHSVRRLLAQATIDTFLHSDTFKFSEEIREEPEFAADVLQELKVSLKSVKPESYVCIHFKEPLSGKEVVFNPH